MYFQAGSGSWAKVNGKYRVYHVASHITSYDSHFALLEGARVSPKEVEGLSSGYSGPLGVCFETYHVSWVKGKFARVVYRN